MRTFVSRRALVYGASGLTGRALLSQLAGDVRYAEIHALLRRPTAGLPSDPRLSYIQVDFDRLPAELPVVDDVYCCAGTTIRAAGSQTAFRAVDFDLVVRTAQAARRLGAERLAVVSALGADSNSRVFYNRVKGEMEHAVAQLGYGCVVLARPSLLLGDRAATGQAPRIGERLAIAAMSPLSRMLPMRWRPIDAARLAAALRHAVAEDAWPGVRIIESAELLLLGARAVPPPKSPG